MSSACDTENDNVSLKSDSYLAIPTVTSTETTPIRQYTRRTRIAQSSFPPTVADEPTSPQRDVSQGEACPTDSGFIADQDRETIDKSFTLPHDSAPRVTSSAAIEGSMQQTIPELMALCTSLQRQLSELTDKFQAQEVEIKRLKESVKQLEEREGVATTNSRDDAPIKGRSMDEGEAATERVSDDTEEIATVLTSMDIPTASTPAEGSVPTGSEEVPTASPVFATATVAIPVTRRNGKEKEDQRKAEQIARDPKIARIHAKEEPQSMIGGLDSNNETVAKYLEEYRQFSSDLAMERGIELISDLVKYQENYAKSYKFQSQQRKPWTKKQKRDYYMAVIRNNLGWKVKDFRGMTFEEVEAKFNSVWKQMEDFIPKGSKEKAKRRKKKAKDKEIFMLVEKDYPLRKGLALVMICYKLQVENFSQMANELVLTIYRIANFPRQQVIKFPLAEEVPTASVEGCHCQKKSEATARKITLLSKVKKKLGNSKGGKITGKGKIRTGKLDFEDVYFVKELKFNLFSVTQMCDKKNNVLFTDTACVVLSSDFKLTDESHVLLKVSRKDHMYNVDLKNVPPQGGRKPALSFMRPFGCPVTIFNTIDHLGKFDGKVDEGFFVGYSTNSKAFRVFNYRTRIVEENLHVKFSENAPNMAGSGPNWLFDIDALTKSMNYTPVVVRNQSNGIVGTKACDNIGKTREETIPDKDYILLPLWTQYPPFSSSSKDSLGARFKQSGAEEKKDVEDPWNEDSEVLSTKERRVNQEKDANVNSTNNINTVSLTYNAAGIEDNAIDENIVYRCADDPNMPDLEEIGRFSDAKNDDSGADMNNLDTYFQEPKWVFRNKKDERGIVIKNKARLVAQRYTQEEGIDYDEVFVPVARIEEIRLFLAYASFKDFVVYQMDVKRDFLYG
nr:putative polyprotein [Tanacetum cinerariifolium]